MPQIQSETKNVKADDLHHFVASLFRAADLPDKDADLVTGALVEANLRGIDTHGVARVPHYLARIRLKSIKTHPIITCEKLGPSVALVDGDDCMGMLAMYRAAEEAISMAREVGSAWVSLKNSSHCGALSNYGLKIAESGMIGFAFTHVGSVVVPHGSREAFCGTNPICITAPGKDGTALCLDMATSLTPWNSIMNARIEGREVPDTWGIDEDGAPESNPEKVVAINPVGSYKGSGLGLMIDVLCSMLSQVPYGPDIHYMYGDLALRRELGGMVGAIDISRFLEVEQFQERITELMMRWNSLKPLDPEEPVMLPGGPELKNKAERLKEGIPVGLSTLNELKQEAERLEIDASGFEPYW